VFYYILDAQLFLQPLLVPHKEGNTPCYIILVRSTLNCVFGLSAYLKAKLRVTHTLRLFFTGRECDMCLKLI